MALTVGQLAKLAGLTVRALHHYDAIGLLTPKQRSAGGYRLYNDADVVRLYRIQTLRALGMALPEIAGALKRGGSAVPQLIDRQLAALDARIAAAERLRARLRRLQSHVQRGEAPDARDWLRVLEQLALYEAHCTPEELERLLAHDNDAEWTPFLAEARAAMQRGEAVDGATARALAQRWVQLTSARFGGDFALAKKIKRVHLERSEAMGAARGDADRPLLEYLGHAVTALHAHLWMGALGPRSARALRPQGRWSTEWIDVVAELRRARTGPRTLARAGELLDDFCAGSAALRAKVLHALASHADLRLLWSLDDDTLRIVAALPARPASRAPNTPTLNKRRKTP